MKILFVKRFKNRKRKGGIARSNELIEEYLKKLDVNISNDSIIVDTIFDTNPIPILETYDIIFIYGDYNKLDEYVLESKKFDIPILVNSVYNNRINRCKNIIKMYNKYGDNFSNVFFMVFAPDVINDVNLNMMKHHIIYVPKSFRTNDKQNNLKFNDRCGICIGDKAKNTRNDLIGDLDINHIISELQKENIPITTYNQYSTDNIFSENVIEVSYQDNMVEFLGKFRLFLSFVKHETFAMVPIESQMTGTPVLYTPMIQSLSSYIGPSGIPCYNEDDFIENVKLIYHNKYIWDNYNEMSVKNYDRMNIKYLINGFYIAFKTVIRRYKNIINQV